MFIIWFTFDMAKVGAQRAVWPSQAPDITLQYLAGSHLGPHATHSLTAVKAKQPLSADPAVMRSGSRLMPVQDAGIRYQGSGPLNTKSPGSRRQESMLEEQVLIKYQKKNNRLWILYKNTPFLENRLLWAADNMPPFVKVCLFRSNQGHRVQNFFLKNYFNNGH